MKLLWANVFKVIFDKNEWSQGVKLVLIIKYWLFVKY